MQSGFIRLLLVTSFSLFIFFLQTATAEETTVEDNTLQRYNIGIITDGPLALTPSLVGIFKQEIAQMAEGEFLVAFPEKMILEADSTAQGVNQLIDTLLSNPETDLIITLGVIGSTEALKRQNLTKPIVAPFIFDTDLQKAPTSQFSSGIGNLFFVNLGTTIHKELTSFRKLYSFKKLAILIDERDLQNLPGVEKYVRKIGYEHSLTVDLIPVGHSLDTAIAKIPKETTAVMVGPLWQLNHQQVTDLSNKFIERKIAAFAMSEYDYVEAGFFATTMPENTLEHLARQVAISIQEILLGENPANLPVTFSKTQKLTINMKTARAIEVYPSLDYMTGSHLLHVERGDIERKVTLPEVVSEALVANLDLAVAEREVVAGSYKVGEARSALLPQLTIGTGVRTIDNDRAEFSRGSSPENAWTGTVAASQQIYSENDWAGYTVEKHLQSGKESARDSVRLDIIYETSTTYLNVLRSKTVEQLQKENMQLTQANLERAQLRLSTGVAGPDELYRWESEFANDRQVVLHAESATLSSMQALNRILSRPLREEFIAQETDLSDPLLIGGDRLFYDLIHNPLYFYKFNDFAVSKGLAASPELKVLDSAIAAQERLITRSKRDFWVPTISIDGSVDTLFAEGGDGQRDEDLTGLDDTDWQIGVYARLPLFEGGRKNATRRKNQEQLLQLQTEKRATEERIQQLILQALNNTRASYPSINLSRDAVDAARRNLVLVTDSYVQGIKDIISLLDAQNQALSAELDAANAVYNFLIDLMGVQRSIGTFITFESPENGAAWIQEVQTYLGISH